MFKLVLDWFKLVLNRLQTSRQGCRGVNTGVDKGSRSDATLVESTQ